MVCGEVPACLEVRLACQRQLDDLKRKDWEYHWDAERGNKICRFIELLPHIKGRWSTKNIRLQDWQCFILTTIFGWVDDNDLRRYQKALIVVPRKNAKTTIAAGIGLYMLVADGEPGAEVYSAATTRDQSKICFGTARSMVLKLPKFQRKFKVQPWQHTLEVPATSAVFRPLSREAGSLEGLNVHCGIVDEIHAHKTREVFDVIDTATGSRSQPLLLGITTAGSNRTGIAKEQQDYITSVLRGRVEDEQYFGIIYTIDEGDDWTTLESAIKANPNWGASVQPKVVEALRRQALVNPAAQNTYKAKRLDIWTSVGEAYFNLLAWDQRCKADIAIAEFEGLPCWFGLDLASKTDIAAFMILFRRAKHWAVFGRYYLPEEKVAEGNPNYDFYRGWAGRENFIFTPGNVIDFEFIERDLQEYATRLHPREVCYDPYQATQLSTRMEARGLPMVEVPATVRQFSEPMKELGKLILAGDILHDGDPVLSWMVGNVVAKVDAKENVYPRKEQEAQKIDGVIGTIMPLSRALTTEIQRVSVYADPAAVI